MFYWSPSNKQIESWIPRGGWNTVFSEKEKLQGTNLFFFLKNKKGYTESVSNTIMHMYLFKQKYENLRYSEEQEKMITRSVAT